MTLNQIAATTIPQSIGCCQGDLNTLAAYLNEAIQSLVNSAGETGWSFGWKRVVFNVDPDNPYIICPREIARLVNADVRNHPTRINNEWYEFLEGGPGLQTTCQCGIDSCHCGSLGIFDRGYFPPLEIAANNYVRVYLTDTRDVGRRILFSRALDANGVRIYTQDGVNAIDGFYLTLENSFVTSSFEVTGFEAILKDATYGDVILKTVDADTSVETTVARIQPDELTPAYRKYFIKNLPAPCNYDTTTQITALAKLEFIPLVRGTDFLLISNIPALRLECESIRYSKIEKAEMQNLSILKHKQAIRQLQNEQRHIYGEQRPAITQPLAGIEHLRYHGIGTLT